MKWFASFSLISMNWSEKTAAIYNEEYETKIVWCHQRRISKLKFIWFALLQCDINLHNTRDLELSVNYCGIFCCIEYGVCIPLWSIIRWWWWCHPNYNHPKKPPLNLNHINCDRNKDSRNSENEKSWHQQKNGSSLNLYLVVNKLIEKYQLNKK